MKLNKRKKEERKNQSNPSAKRASHLCVMVHSCCFVGVCVFLFVYSTASA